MHILAAHCKNQDQSRGQLPIISVGTQDSYEIAVISLLTMFPSSGSQDWRMATNLKVPLESSQLLFPLRALASPVGNGVRTAQLFPKVVAFSVERSYGVELSLARLSRRRKRGSRVWRRLSKFQETRLSPFESESIIQTVLQKRTTGQSDSCRLTCSCINGLD